MNLITWLDIERVINEHTAGGSKMPSGVTSISCYSEVIEFNILNDNAKDQLFHILQQWFGLNFKFDNDPAILLDIEDIEIPIQFEINNDNWAKKNRPLWHELIYINQEIEQSYPLLPKAFDANPHIAAFHSFKGGVGRTTTLATYARAFFDIYKSKKILIIDADLEAPGLTYWFKASKEISVSLLSFLEAVHYPAKDIQSSINYFATELRRYSWESGVHEIFFLPACTDTIQLLDMPVLPEHLVRNPDNPWLLTDYIHQLGKTLEVDLVLIDLRAGLSELSSPLLFDPRIERFLITTIAEQSVRGTELILEQMRKFAEAKFWNNDTIHPHVVISLLTRSLRETQSYSNCQFRLQKAYNLEYEDGMLDSILDIQEIEFTNDFMNIASWDEAFSCLTSSSLFKHAKNWSSSLISPIDDNQLNNNSSNQAKSLAAICKKFEFAENGDSDDLLITDPLRNLAKHYDTRLPNIISIGAKGSGKTFNYIQLCRLKSWDKFVRKVGINDNFNKQTSYILPILQSQSLKDKARKIVNEARQNAGVTDFSHKEAIKMINTYMEKPKSWDCFWISMISEIVGYKVDTINELNNKLSSHQKKIVLIFDGLEDIFPRISIDEKQQNALKALLGIVDWIEELRSPNLGCIIFIREDYLKYLYPQNLNQFKNKFESYHLIWDAKSFLKLVFWICHQAEIELEDNLDSSTALIKLWGEKLGKANSREARTIRWVYSVLSDLNGKLQARDIIRFLRYAAENANEEKSFKDRILPPSAIRKALKPCSEKKVEEAQQEYKELQEWIKTLINIDEQYKKIPFSYQKVGLTYEKMERLKELGIIFEDQEIKDDKQFYLPEIYRIGLNFTSSTSARPKVMSLLRRSIGKLPF